MTKDEVLAKVQELNCVCVQNVDGITHYGSPEEADRQMKIVRDHLIALTNEGTLRFIEPSAGEVEKWEII